MYLYRWVPTNQRPLRLHVDSETFTQEWCACWADPTRDANPLVEMADPALRSWERMLRRQDPPDINILSLCAGFNSEIPIAIDMIDHWITQVEQTRSVHEQLQWLMVYALRAGEC